MLKSPKASGKIRGIVGIVSSCFLGFFGAVGLPSGKLT